MDLKNLNTFVQAAELGSFSKAGERLGYSQPTVSVQIKQLEEELDSQLFDRIGHTVRLTDKGREILVYAHQIAGLCRQMTGPSNPEQEQIIIRLATADSLCGPLMDREFSRLRRSHPNISVKLTTAGTDELFRLLDHNEADLVCTLDNHIYNSNYVIAAEEPVGVHFVVSTAHPLAKKQVLTKEDLLCQDVLLTEQGMSYRRLLDEWMAKNSLQLQPVLETGSADLLCRLAEEGVGISFLPDYVTAAAVNRGTILRLDVQGFQPELWKQLLYHRSKWLSPAMETVVHHLAQITLQSP